MAQLVFANNATSTIAGAITNTSTSVSLQTGEGALFPSPTGGDYFIGSFVDAATGLLTEIIKCTARSGDVLTIVRAQESTSALPWSPGDFFSNLWTAGQAAEMLQQNQAPASQIFYGASDTGSVNAIVTTVSPTLGAYSDGQIFEIQPAFTNTSQTVTLNISAFGNINGYRFDGSALLVGDYLVGSRTLWAYKSSIPALYLLNPGAPSPSNIPPRNLVSYIAHGSISFTVPANITWINVRLVGAGAGGAGGGGGVTVAGGGGGSGGYSEGWIAVTPGQVITGTVGQGGAGSNNSNGAQGTTGGTTSFAGLSATGGVGGLTGTASCAGGVGGNGSGGQLNLAGANGGDGNTFQADVQGGLGAASAFGGGGRTSVGTNSAANGVAPGSGGGGLFGGGSAGIGGSGADGAVIITY